MHMYKHTMKKQNTHQKKQIILNVINLMFDLDILLFMFSMCITILSYLDSSHVSIEFQCIHTYMSLLSFPVWRTKVV